MITTLLMKVDLEHMQYLKFLKIDAFSFIQNKIQPAYALDWPYRPDLTYETWNIQKTFENLIGFLQMMKPACVFSSKSGGASPSNVRLVAVINFGFYQQGFVAANRADLKTQLKQVQYLSPAA